jgi:hypothetical protein
MERKYIQFSIAAVILVGLMVLAGTTRAQTPTPSQYDRPDYNYAESSSCTRCHFMRGSDADHNNEAVGIMYDDTAKKFYLTGNGWRASKHSQTNYGSTQNTYCAKCHSPLQAKPEATFKKGKFFNTEHIADGQVEGVTCAACHPSHTVAEELGRRLGIYQFGKDKNTAEAYQVVNHGQEDQLCLNCHVSRHNEDIPAFKLMYDAGVKCIDCHMAPYGYIVGTEIEKRFHDFKVANNLPYSCGVQGSLVSCHPGMTVEGTRNFIPLLKKQHKEWWPGKMKALNNVTASDYMALWQQVEAETALAK